MGKDGCVVRVSPIKKTKNLSMINSDATVLNIDFDDDAKLMKRLMQLKSV